MTVDVLRTAFDQHFALNRAVWERCIEPLSQEAFTRPTSISIGSIRNHIVHVINHEERWLCVLQGLDFPDIANPYQFADRAEIRRNWDTVEGKMRDYLARLEAPMLDSQPLRNSTGEKVVLSHVLERLLDQGERDRIMTLELMRQLDEPELAAQLASILQAAPDRPV